eukprot:287599-Rhodomonas_salina.6
MLEQRNVSATCQLRSRRDGAGMAFPQVKDARDLNKKPLCIGMKSEPSFIALGGQHVGMGVNNLCWFYTRDKSATMVNECEYLASVDHVSMNSTKVPS